MNSTFDSSTEAARGRGTSNLQLGRVKELVQTRKKTPSIQALLIFLLYVFSAPKKFLHKHRLGFHLNKTICLNNTFDL